MHEMVNNREQMKFHMNEYKRLRATHDKHCKAFMDALNNDSDNDTNWAEQSTKGTINDGVTDMI